MYSHVIQTKKDHIFSLTIRTESQLTMRRWLPGLIGLAGFKCHKLKCIYKCGVYVRHRTEGFLTRPYHKGKPKIQSGMQYGGEGQINNVPPSFADGQAKNLN